MQRRKFSREFKFEAVRMVCERGVIIAQASRARGFKELTARCRMRLSMPQGLRLRLRRHRHNQRLAQIYVSGHSRSEMRRQRFLNELRQQHRLGWCCCRRRGFEGGRAEWTSRRAPSTRFYAVQSLRRNGPGPCPSADGACRNRSRRSRAASSPRLRVPALLPSLPPSGTAERPRQWHRW